MIFSTCKYILCNEKKLIFTVTDLPKKRGGSLIPVPGKVEFAILFLYNKMQACLHLNTIKYYKNYSSEFRAFGNLLYAKKYLDSIVLDFYQIFESKYSDTLAVLRS